MNFRSPLILSPSSLQIHYSSNILSIGSCFAQNIAHNLTELKYNLLANPAGICFNPVSVLHTIKRCIKGDSLPETEIINSHGLWCHHDFHGSFNHPDKNTCIQSINSSIEKANNFLKSVDRVILTIGTAYVYELENHVVNNCHKRPQNLFNKRRLEREEIKNTLFELIELLNAYSNQKIEYILTLSPVRHLKDGMVQNNLSKATCLLAIDDVVQSDANVHYFPSYELLMDDLRDYRFYAKDRVHPSEEAIEYVFNKFEQVHLYENDAALRKRIAKLNLALAHRPFNPESDQHILFKEDLVAQLTELEQAYSFLDFTKEKQELLS